MLSWTKLNPTCKVKNTTKKYFNKYLYKAVVFVPAGRIITNKDYMMSIHSQVELRRSVYTKIGYTGRYFKQHSLKYLSLDKANATQLEYWKNVFGENSDKLKYRIEEPWMQVYANDEQFLYDLVSEDCDNLLEIYKPENDTDRQLLEDGTIIMAKSNGYNYRIYLKEGYPITSELRESIGRYLINLGDEVKLTKGALKNLMNRKFWFNGTYFYAKDDSVITFLNLMAPGIIAGIFKITCKQQ